MMPVKLPDPFFLEDYGSNLNSDSPASENATDKLSKLKHVSIESSEPSSNTRWSILRLSDGSDDILELTATAFLPSGMARRRFVW